MEYKRITFEIINNIARIGFGHNSKKPMTTLELETLEELDPALKEIKEKQEKEIKGLIFFSHKKNVFLAGMNVTVIRDLKTVDDGIKGCQQGQGLYNQIEDLLIPTVACVDGVCLGGGLELSLACKAIVVSNSPATVLGVPEVGLGLLPGFGGSYRLPRRVELSKALELILSGRPVKGKKAMEIGLVDQVYPKERLVEMAISEYMGEPKRAVSLDRPIKKVVPRDSSDQKAIFKKARASVLKTTKGNYEAPLRILDLWESSLEASRSAYLQKEAQLLGELAVSEQSRNLQNIYFLHANSQKYKGPGSDKEKLIIKSGAVVGAGAIGGEIAWLMARRDMAPIMKDVTNSGLESGLKQSENIFFETVKKRLIDQDESKKMQSSIKAQLDYHGFDSIDLVVEATEENIEIKKGVFAELENEVEDDCLITSNTSSLSINEMASFFYKPERFAGLHFFNPVNRVPLVEIITHDQIAPGTISALYGWVVRAKKIPVVVKDGPGFLLYRILAPYINEAFYLLDEGVPIDELEQACLSFGMPAGPCQLLDDMGLEVGYKVISALYEAAGDRYKPAATYEKLLDLNCLGKKDYKGFFIYDEQGRKLEVNKDIYKILPAIKIKKSENEIQKRIFLSMINEAARMLEEQIVKTVEELDLGLVFGIGFPRIRGGLLKYADSQGLGNILKGLDQYAEDVDTERYEACPLIKELAKRNNSFYA